MARAPAFLTVPVELQSIAHACLIDLKETGFSVRCELSSHDFPETATIYAKRKRAIHFFIFDAKIKLDRLSLWSGYGRSCSSDTYVTLCIPNRDTISPSKIVEVRQLGIGLKTIDDQGVLAEIIPPRDLSMNIQLPPLEPHKKAIRQELALIHRYFEGDDWRRGFEEACKLVESKARRHLEQQITKGAKVQVQSKKGPKFLTTQSVRKMTLGQLAQTFCDVVYPKSIDTLLCTGLKKINPDRISVAHRRTDAKAERKLRENVGRHMWTIDNLLKGLSF